MKLIACHVENFGKLSDFTMNFSEGINVINESNAWGKSTLAAFLKAMFYGLDAKKDPKAFEKERNMYRPWQGGAFGGEVDFETDGKKYRISRTFGRTEKTDEFHLYDLSTNLESHDYSMDIGIELFDLDSTSFKKSIFIAQNDCASETSDGINAKLGNLAESAHDINNFEGASQRLKEILNQLTPERVTGSIKKRKNYITQLTQELRSFDSAKDGFEGISLKKKAMDSQIDELFRIRKNYADALVIASEDSRKQELYRQYDALCQDVTIKEKNLEEYITLFPKEVPSKEVFDKQMKDIRMLEELNTSLRLHKLTDEEEKNWDIFVEMFGQKKPSVEGIDVAISTLADAEKLKEEMNRQKSRYLISEAKKQELEALEPPTEGSIGHQAFLYPGIGILFIGIVIAILGGFDFFHLPQAHTLFICGVFAALCGVAFTAVGLVLRGNAIKNNSLWQREQEESLSVIDEELKLLSDNMNKITENSKDVLKTISTFLETYHVYCETEKYPAKLYELKTQLAEFERLETKKSAYDALCHQYEEKRASISGFEAEYGLTLGEELAVGLSTLQNKATEYRLAKEAFAESVKKRELFENAREKTFWTKEARCPYTIEELNQMIAQADAKLEELKAAGNQYVKQLEDLQEQLDLRDEKSAELEEQLRQQEADTAKYDLVKKTHEFLQKAKEQFIAKYMGPISKGFSKYYTMLTGDSRGEWMIDANINLKVREYGELRETHWLSAGYQDLIGVCMRLALVDAMYQNEKPFLILDDPFVNLDKEKVEYGNQLLLSVSKEYQVIYFTCHDSRSPL